MIIELMSYSYSSNSYIITGERNILIDPGLPNNEALRSYLHRRPTRIDSIINTHCHYDHIGGDFGEDIMVHEDDADAVSTAGEKTMFGSFVDSFSGFEVTRRLKEGDRIDNGEHILEVIHTPGHTSGSICLLDRENDTMFSGDTWFYNGVGRTDLPSGDLDQLRGSFMRLREIDVTHICPGHGSSFKNNIDYIIDNYFFVV
ncbi:MAG: MBL fold metallo-hydrolase [Candidatus Methanofastidiosa archaeon]|nr:MBL fold metallo-hydrolase [Candidatus Methanofastidiosa archaeon]